MYRKIVDTDCASNVKRSLVVYDQVPATWAKRVDEDYLAKTASPPRCGRADYVGLSVAI